MREIKYDINTAENFQLFGFATGTYYFRCHECGAEFYGDKLSIMCLSCAIKMAEDSVMSKSLKNELGDDLCRYCQLVKKGTYSVPGGFMAGCEGSHCDDAYEHYLESVPAESVAQITELVKWIDSLGPNVSKIHMVYISEELHTIKEAIGGYC